MPDEGAHFKETLKLFPDRVVPCVVKTLNKLSLIGGAFLASLTCGVVAQTAAPGNSSGPAENCGSCGKCDKEGKHGRHNPMEKLNLTEEQKTQIHPIMKKAREEAKAIKADATLTPEQKKQQLQALRQSTDEQLKTILTPEQFQKLEAIRAERKEKHSKGEKTEAPATT